MVPDSQASDSISDEPGEKSLASSESRGTRLTAGRSGSGSASGSGTGTVGLGLGEMDLMTLTEHLAGSSPAPGAGSGAAAIASLGSALVSMAFRKSSGEGASSQAPYMQGRAAGLDRLTDEFRRLIDADAEAYSSFLDARAMESKGDAAKAKRRAALESAARATIEVPFEILEAALAGLRLAAVGAPDQHRNLLCETATGAFALFSVVESCARIVRENLPIAAVESEQFAEQHGRALPALLEEATLLLEEIRTATAPDDGSSPSA